MLSPGFDPGTTEYVIYLPYEVQEINVSASAYDGKASTSIEGHDNLKSGEINLVLVNCTAEDESIKTYTIAAVRAAEFTGLENLGAKITPTPTPEPNPTPEPTVAPTVTTTTPTTIATEDNTTDLDDSDRANGGDLFKIILIGVLAAIAIAEGVMLVVKSKKVSK